MTSLPVRFVSVAGGHAWRAESGRCERQRNGRGRFLPDYRGPGPIVVGLAAFALSLALRIRFF